MLQSLQRVQDLPRSNASELFQQLNTAEAIKCGNADAVAAKSRLHCETESKTAAQNRAAVFVVKWQKTKLKRHARRTLRRQRKGENNMPQQNEIVCELLLPFLIVVGLIAVVVCQFIFNRNEF